MRSGCELLSRLIVRFLSSHLSSCRLSWVEVDESVRFFFNIASKTRSILGPLIYHRTWVIIITSSHFRTVIFILASSHLILLNLPTPATVKQIRVQNRVLPLIIHRGPQVSITPRTISLYLTDTYDNETAVKLVVGGQKCFLPDGFSLSSERTTVTRWLRNRRLPSSCCGKR